MAHRAAVLLVASSLAACASSSTRDAEIATVDLAPNEAAARTSDAQMVPLIPPEPGARSADEPTKEELLAVLMNDQAALDSLGVLGATGTTIDNAKGSGSGTATAGGGVLSLGGSGTSGGLTAAPSRPASAATINGKPMKDATTADVTAAVGAAGCGAAPVAGQQPGAVLAVACGDRAYELTFVAANVTLDEAARGRLREAAASIDEGGALLVVRAGKNTDAERAALLLRRLHGHPEGAAPVARASLSAAKVEGSAVDNAARIVAGMAAGVRRCYRRGLAEDATMAGSVEITMKLGPNGEVLAATPGTTSGNVSSTVVACIAARGAAAQFSPPHAAGDARVRFTATLSSVEP